MRHFRDYLGVWPDVGDPPAVPFPPVIGLTILAIDPVRYLEWAGGRWLIPADPPDPPVTADESEFTPDERVYADLHPGRMAEYVKLGRRDNGPLDVELAAALGRLNKTWIHPVGDRVDIADVRVTAVDSLGQGDYGERLRVKFDTPTHSCVWWTNAPCWMEPGWTGTVRATVKAHGMWGGEKVTTVERCSDPTKPKKRAKKDDA